MDFMIKHSIKIGKKYYLQALNIIFVVYIEKLRKNYYKLVYMHFTVTRKQINKLLFCKLYNVYNQLMWDLDYFHGYPAYI